jgi:hypothetical protein
MRQKIISLSLDTYELASKKANFSAWVRRQLLDEQRKKDYEYGRTHNCSKCGSEYPNIRDALMCKCQWVAKTDVKE